MKKLIDGVTYNTATSTALATAEWENDEGEQNSGTLYQTRGGAFFVDTEITSTVWNQAEQAHQQRVKHVFQPLSPEDALKWLNEGEVEILHNPFDTEPPEAAAEAEPGATIYLRVPVALKQRVEQAARVSNASANVWAMRCFERCLESER